MKNRFNKAYIIIKTRLDFVGAGHIVSTKMNYDLYDDLKPDYNDPFYKAKMILLINENTMIIPIDVLTTMIDICEMNVGLI